MHPDREALLLRLWREDLHYIHAGTSPPAHHFFPGYLPANGQRFRSTRMLYYRVMKRLREGGWKYKEIAGVWGISISSVNVGLRRLGEMRSRERKRF